MPYSTPDLRLAASLAYLGYPCEFRPIVHERTRQRQVMMFFDPRSVRFPNLPPVEKLVADHLARALAPMHVLSVVMRAHHNYDALLKWQGSEAIPHHLQPVFAPEDTQQQKPLAYRYADARSASPSSAPAKTLTCLALTAALAEVGIDVTAISGSPGAHTYHLRAHGLPILDAHGVSWTADAQHLTQLAPSTEDPRRLLLEVTQPQSPVVHAYNALRCRALLKKQIESATAQLLLEDGPRSALLPTCHPTGRVMDLVTAHFRSVA